MTHEADLSGRGLLYAGSTPTPDARRQAEIYMSSFFTLPFLPSTYRHTLRLTIDTARRPPFVRNICLFPQPTATDIVEYAIS